MDFNINDLSSIEFSINTENKPDGGCDKDKLYRISTDRKVKKLLVKCLEATRAAFPDNLESVPDFEISEKYSDRDRYKVSLEVYDAAQQMANETLLNHVFLNDLDKDSISYYRVDFTDSNGTHLIGVRRASYFKSLLKNRNRLIQLVDDSLVAVEDTLFKLDNDFDFIILDGFAYIKRPRVFESMIFPDEEVTRIALEKMGALQDSLPFIDFSTTNNIIQESKRAARLVFAVAQRADISSTDKSKIIYYAGNSGIEIDEVDEIIKPREGYEVDFLEMLDRRIYNVEFIEGETESYRAHSRQRR